MNANISAVSGKDIFFNLSILQNLSEALSRPCRSMLSFVPVGKEKRVVMGIF